MVFTDSVEVKLDVSPSQLWKTLPHIPTLAPKLLPDLFVSFEQSHGDGGVGTVRKVTIKDPHGEVHVDTEVVDLVDDKTHTFKWHVEDGEVKKFFSSNSTTVTILPGADAGKSRLKQVFEAELIGELPPPAIGEGHKKAFTALAHALEGHIKAHEADYA